MRRELSKLSQPYSEMRVGTKKQAEGKEPPSLGSGGPSLTAIGLHAAVGQPLQAQMEKRTK
jgi:hypothetical protein